MQKWQNLIFNLILFSLRTALYGEQQKEVLTLKKKARKSKARKKLGILEKVQEVGPERFLSPAPLEEESEVEESEVQVLNQDWDELIDIKPGTLTVSRGMRATRHDSDLFGELKVSLFFFFKFLCFEYIFSRKLGNWN